MYLGLVAGTSDVKAVLANEAGEIVARAGRELALSHPAAPLWSELHLDAPVNNTIGAVDDLAAAHPRESAQVRGIGLSGQMHGARLLLAHERSRRPAILREDGRPHAECTALERKCASLHAIVGNLAMPGFTAPKLTGVARHEPTGYMAMAVVQMVVARSPSWEESS